MIAQITSDHALPNEVLVDNLIEVSGEVALVKVGYVVDALASVVAADRDFIKGVILARLSGKRPPCLPGMTVVVKHEGGVPEKESRAPALGYRSEHEVKRVWYVDRDWYLELKLGEVRGDTLFPIYRASAFHILGLGIAI